jgi:hypothetical protein
MKRIGRLILLAAFAGSGCMTLPPLWTEAKTEQPAAVETTDVAPPPPPALPEQVNEANAKEMLNALREELDYAANERPTVPKTTVTISKSKP